MTINFYYVIDQMMYIDWKIKKWLSIYEDQKVCIHFNSCNFIMFTIFNVYSLLINNYK